MSHRNTHYRPAVRLPRSARGALLAICAVFIALAPSLVRAEAPPELRGMWVNAWGRGLRSPSEVAAVVKTARSARLNALFVQVRRRGDALYASDLVPRCAAVPAGFDPLAETIARGHAAGLEVHAWLPLMPAWSAQAGQKPPAGHILLRHPEWATVNVNGRRMSLADGAEGIFLDPGVPGVQAALSDVVAEIAMRYPDLDGIHLDYVRYPGPQWGYNPIATARFRQETGHTPSGSPAAFANWRREQVTDLVARIRAAARAENPDLKLSVAVFADRKDAHAHRLQDWPEWMVSGLVDFVCPMNYATSLSTFTARSKDALSRPGAPAYIGIGAWNKPVASAVKQAIAARSMGAGGMVFYDYANTRPDLWPALAKALFHKDAPTPWAETRTAVRNQHAGERVSEAR